MPCGSCGAENPPGTKFCANCGTARSAQQGAAQGFGGTVVPPAPRQPSSVSIDFRRLGTGDIVAVAVRCCCSSASSCRGTRCPAKGSPEAPLRSAAIQVDGAFSTSVLDIVILLFLFVRTMTPRGFRLPLPYWQLLTVLLCCNSS